MANGQREKCANIGCYNLQVPSRGKINAHGTRYRAVCSSCHEASYKGYALPHGVTDFKKYCCSNRNGTLGFPCSTDHSKLQDTRGKFHIDHIDGDCTNNQLSNLQELCLNCHQEKGMRAGDYAKTINTGRASKSAKKSSSVNMFDELFGSIDYVIKERENA